MAKSLYNILSDISKIVLFEPRTEKYKPDIEHILYLYRYDPESNFTSKSYFLFKIHYLVNIEKYVTSYIQEPDIALYFNNTFNVYNAFSIIFNFKKLDPYKFFRLHTLRHTVNSIVLISNRLTFGQVNQVGLTFSDDYYEEKNNILTALEKMMIFDSPKDFTDIQKEIYNFAKETYLKERPD